MRKVGYVLTRQEKLEMLTEFAMNEELEVKVRMAAIEILNRMEGHNEPEAVSVSLSSSLMSLLSRREAKNVDC